MIPGESDTLRFMAAMTDAGEFEKLATAVLRIGDPIYRSVGHTGVNADGKTIKAPVDNVGFVRGAVPPHMVTAHHTISARTGLEVKWLHDPATVVTRNAKGVPTAPAGDLLKTANVVRKLREEIPDLQATLALTCSSEPPLDVTNNTVAEGHRLGISVDIWPAARIAGILDDDPDGQWIRFKFLGVKPRRVSLDLLKSLSIEELNKHATADDQALRVGRSLDDALTAAVETRPMTFLVAASGTGKTVSCHELLRRHIQAGGHGFIIDPSTVETAQSLENAYEAILKRVQPDLAPGCGAAALALATPEARLLLLVEDVNRSSKPDVVLERLASWIPNPAAGEVTARDIVSWRVVCPTWMRSLDLLSDRARESVSKSILLGGSFGPSEGAAAVAKRVAALGIQLLPLEIEQVSHALGNDPLLIGLHDFQSEASPDLAISNWISASIRRLAAEKQSYTATDYQNALDRLARTMLSRRQIRPSWSNITEWFAVSGDETLPMLRHLIAHQEIVRLDPWLGTEELLFRHDRIRDEVLVKAVSRMLLSAEMPEELWSEPFFAEVLGRVLAREEAPDGVLAKVRDSNPLALFHAFSTLASKSSTRRAGIVRTIEEWLTQPESRGRASYFCRWAALRVLSNIEAPEVSEMVDKLDLNSDEALQAAFRNGRVDAGYRLCGRVPPGVIDPWRDRVVAHAAERYGDGLIAAVARTLADQNVDSASLTGALRLAGFLGSGSLAGPLAASWLHDGHRSANLSDHLWASLRCCRDDADSLLKNVCDAWAALSDSRSDESLISPREDISAHELAFAIGRWGASAPALNYLGRRAAEDHALRRPISALLRFLDNPDAVAIRVSANAKLAQDGGYQIHSTAVGVGTTFRVGEEFSAPTRDRLQAIWSDGSAEANARHEAFNIWETGRGTTDLAALRAIPRDDALLDAALGARLRRGDHDACPDFLEKLQGPHSTFWWQLGRHYWSAELTTALDQEIRRAYPVATKTDPERLESVIIALLARLPRRDAERLIENNWTSISDRPVFVQFALYLGTPRFSELADQALQQFPDKKEALNHLIFTYGVKFTGHPGVTYKGQIESLLPHLTSLSRLNLILLRDECRKHGWGFLAEKLNFALPVEDQRPRPFEDALLIDDLDGCIRSTGIFTLPSHLDGLLKGFPEITRQHLVMLSLNWAEGRGTIEALEIAAAVVAHLGTRQDAKRLGDLVGDLAPELEPEAKAIVTDTDFSVRLYSLV